MDNKKLYTLFTWLCLLLTIAFNATYIFTSDVITMINFDADPAPIPWYLHPRAVMFLYAWNAIAFIVAMLFINQGFAKFRSATKINPRSLLIAGIGICIVFIVMIIHSYHQAEEGKERMIKHSEMTDDVIQGLKRKLTDENLSLKHQVHVEASLAREVYYRDGTLQSITTEDGQTHKYVPTDKDKNIINGIERLNRDIVASQRNAIKITAYLVVLILINIMVGLWRSTRNE